MNQQIKDLENKISELEQIGADAIVYFLQNRKGITDLNERADDSFKMAIEYNKKQRDCNETE